MRKEIHVFIALIIIPFFAFSAQAASGKKQKVIQNLFRLWQEAVDKSDSKIRNDAYQEFKDFERYASGRFEPDLEAQKELLKSKWLEAEKCRYEAMQKLDTVNIDLRAQGYEVVLRGARFRLQRILK